MCLPRASHLLQRFLVKHQNTQVIQPHYSPIWHLQFLAFPKTKITFEREEISDHQWDSGKYGRAADGNWENCVRSQGAYFEGDWGIIVLCTMFLVSSSINVSIFHITWLDTFWTDLVWLLQLFYLLLSGCSSLVFLSANLVLWFSMIFFCFLSFLMFCFSGLDLFSWLP